MGGRVSFQLRACRLNVLEKDLKVRVPSKTKQGALWKDDLWSHQKKGSLFSSLLHPIAFICILFCSKMVPIKYETTDSWSYVFFKDTFYWTYISSIFQTSFFLTCWLKALRLGKESSFFFFLGLKKREVLRRTFDTTPQHPFDPGRNPDLSSLLVTSQKAIQVRRGKPGWILFLRVTCLRQKVTGKQAQI